MAGNKWQISDELWEKMAPLIPEHKTHHPLGTHRKRVDNRAAMNAIFFVL
ncbi:transposase, partial [Escherichia coli]